MKLRRSEAKLSQSEVKLNQSEALRHSLERLNAINDYLKKPETLLAETRAKLSQSEAKLSQSENLLAETRAGPGQGMGAPGEGGGGRPGGGPDRSPNPQPKSSKGGTPPSSLSPIRNSQRLRLDPHRHRWNKRIAFWLFDSASPLILPPFTKPPFPANLLFRAIQSLQIPRLLSLCP